MNRFAFYVMGEEAPVHHKMEFVHKMGIFKERRVTIFVVSGLSSVAEIIIPTYSVKWRSG